MSEKIYDVVIVGAGVAGAILAKTLSNAGKSVLVLEAGDGIHGLDLEPQEARKVYQGYLDTFYKAEAKAPHSPYPNLPAAPSPDVLDVQRIEVGTPATTGYFVQAGPLPFASDYDRTPGGTTLHWLGTCLRMLPNDFQMKAAYGVGVDWPISYEDLRPYYEMAEHEIGVSADVNELYYPNAGADFFGKYEYPMHGIPPSYLDRQFTRAVAGLKIPVSNGAGQTELISIQVTPTPQGRNSTPNAKYRRKGLCWDRKKRKLVWDFLAAGKTYEPVGATWDPYIGQRCEGNASCVPICPVQAKYNALKTFKSAARERLTIVSRAVAFKVDVKSGGSGVDRPVTGIQYKQYKDRTGDEYEIKVARGKRYVLAAHSVENAKLLLASGVANSSDQVGRNLMDHVTLLTWGLMKEHVYPFRGPGSTSNMPVFRDARFRQEHAAFIVPVDNWGWGWPKFSPGSDLDEAVDKMKLFGPKLRSYFEKTLTRQLLLHFECEQLPEPTNRVMIDDKYRDKLGNHRPVLHYDISNYLRKAFVRGKAISDRLFEYAHVEDQTYYDPKDACYFTYEGKGYVYRGAGHLVGTHRMGSHREDSVVNRDQRTWDHHNLFLAGCGNMTTLGTSNPTLTMAALTFWVAENILKDLNYESSH
jgi:choline dehydrogenase-like flavoprotein